MKSWPDRLRELPIERLEALLREQKARVEIEQRNLKTIEEIFFEKASQDKRTIHKVTNEKQEG